MFICRLGNLVQAKDRFEEALERTKEEADLAEAGSEDAKYYNEIGITVRYIMHMSLRRNLTIKSHDHEKEGHFCNCRGISIHLPLTRGVQPSGQLSLYLLNDFNSL